MKLLNTYKSQILGFCLMVALMVLLDALGVDERFGSEIAVMNYISMITAYAVAMFFLSPKSKQE